MNKKLVLGILFYLAIQLIFLLWGSVPFHNDSSRYFENASVCVKHQSAYPCPLNLNDSYINAPVYINYLIILLKIWHSQKIIIISNIVFNGLQLILLYKITLLVFERKDYATITALLYMCYLTNLGLILLNLTELAFGVFILLSIYFYYKKKKLFWLASGVSLALAIGVRPTGFALFFAFLTLLITHHNLKFLHRTAYLTMGLLLTLMAIGISAKHSYGRFLFMSDTGAVNLIMGANGDATGAYNNKVFEKGKIGYIENEDKIPHYEKAKFWNHQAIEWIKHNPLRWASLLPNKLVYLFAWDDWSIYVLLKNDFWNLQVIGKTILQNREEEIFKDETIYFKLSFIFIYLIHHLYYFLILACMIYQFYYYKKNNKQLLFEKCVPFYLFAFYGLVMTLGTVGMARYKYPYFIIMLITISPLIGDYIELKKSGEASK